MERVREAMELALKERWDQPAPLEQADGPATPPAATPVATPPGRVATPGRQASASSEPAKPASAGATGPLHRRRRGARQRAEPAPAAAQSPASPPDVAADEVLLRNRLAAAIDGHPAREAYCLLQAAVLERLDGSDSTWIGVTGPRSGHGKTLTAANLAISLAADARRKVLLIDLDLQQPTLHRVFGLSAEKGLEDCLFGRVPLEDALLATRIDGLTILPMRKASRAAAQVMSSSNLKALLGTLRERDPGQLVIVDLPAVAGGPDGSAAKALVDAVLLVVEDGVTREADYRRTLESIGKGKLIGTVLNRARQPQ